MIKLCGFSHRSYLFCLLESIIFRVFFQPGQRVRFRLIPGIIRKMKGSPDCIGVRSSTRGTHSSPAARIHQTQNSSRREFPNLLCAAPKTSRLGRQWFKKINHTNTFACVSMPSDVDTCARELAMFVRVLLTVRRKCPEHTPNHRPTSVCTQSPWILSLHLFFLLSISLTLSFPLGFCSRCWYIK